MNAEHFPRSVKPVLPLATPPLLLRLRRRGGLYLLYDGRLPLPLRSHAVHRIGLKLAHSVRPHPIFVHLGLERTLALPLVRCPGVAALRLGPFTPAPLKGVHVPGPLRAAPVPRLRTILLLCAFLHERYTRRLDVRFDPGAPVYPAVYFLRGELPAGKELGAGLKHPRSFPAGPERTERGEDMVFLLIRIGVFL